MEEHTAVTLAVQLIALCSVVSALVLYLLCKVRSHRKPSASDDFVFRNVGGGRAVLVTSIDNLLGVHLAYHLTIRGFRVFAGIKPVGADSDEKPDVSEAVPKKILESKLKQFEACCEKEENVSFGSLVVLPLDVTREDLLHDAVGTIRRYLPAGEDGLWAVINTAGVPCRARFDGQDGAYWDTVMRLYVTGTLKVSRTFMPLLRTKRGRLINLGAEVRVQATGCNLAADTAGRYAVEGASAALRHEMRPLGVNVVTLQPEGLPIATLFATPSRLPGSTGYLDTEIRVLPDRSLDVVEDALLTEQPRDSYRLTASSPYTILSISKRLCQSSRPLQV